MAMTFIYTGIIVGMIYDENQHTNTRPIYIKKKSPKIHTDVTKMTKPRNPIKNKRYMQFSK